MTKWIRFSMYNDVEEKQQAFFNAMQTYKTHWFYRPFGYVTSTLILILQAITTLNLFLSYQSMSPLILILDFIVAYILTDFVNGLVHMYMDNNTNYTSVVGPFVAAFHVHHSTLKYAKQSPFSVYFFESGSKFWLLGYLIILLFIQFIVFIPFIIQFILVCFSILSSLAEVSHYWCHNATPKNIAIKWLQKHHVLLSAKHHALHHTEDNVQYAFLNGISDPVINRISRYWYPGYKNHADRHMTAYMKRIGNPPEK